MQGSHQGFTSVLPVDKDWLVGLFKACAVCGQIYYKCDIFWTALIAVTRLFTNFPDQQFARKPFDNALCLLFEIRLWLEFQTRLVLSNKRHWFLKRLHIIIIEIFSSAKINNWIAFDMGTISSPINYFRLTLIPRWISNHVPCRMWHEIHIRSTVGVWEWINNFLPHFIMNVIIILGGIKVKPC